MLPEPRPHDALQHTPRSPVQRPWLGPVLLWASAVLLLLGMAVGSVGLEVLWPPYDAITQQILWQIRLPRSLGAWLAGALLGLAGAVAQGLFRNPLADPFLLGSASGAALGTALALLLAGSGALGTVTGLVWLPHLGMTGMAFVGAAAAVLLALVLAQGAHNGLRLLLAGVVVGVVLGALREVLELRHPDLLQPMKAFGLGSTALVGWPACALMAAVWLVCSAAAWMLARVLDALALGEATAASLGLPLAPLRAALIAVLALATGTAVAHTGLIAFVGLAAPHVVRGLVRAPYRRSLWLASAMGGLLLLGADILARSLLAPQELPVGVLTALLGGSYLLWLMHRGQQREVV